MANANSTPANLASSKALDFVAIPFYFANADPKQFSAYIPVILMNGEYDDELGIGLGKSISLESLSRMEDALEAARTSYLSTSGAIGYTVKGVNHD